MNAVLSTLFGIAAAIVGILVFAILFVVRAGNFWPSVAISLVIASLLFGTSVFFDRRDARLHQRPYRKVLPSQMGVLSFCFVVFVAVVFFGFIAAVVYGWLQIPAGDDWEIAATRLAFVFGVVLLGWQSCNAVRGIAHRFFQGYVYDDWLESVGKPMSFGQVCSHLNRKYTPFWLIIFAFVGIAILCDALELLEPMLQWKGGGRKIRKYKMLLGWMLKHPNTVDLFAFTTAFISLCVIAWRLHHLVFDRFLLGDREE